MITISNTVKNCPYIKDITNALKKVGQEYVIYIDTEGSNKNKNKNKIKYTERVFAYEFYHRYRCIMERKKEFYKGLYLNGEQPKNGQIWKGLAAITPDLVLHGQINIPDYSGESQKWLCEIKMAGNPKIIDDIKKIKRKESKLKFNDYIYMCVGIKIDILKNKIMGEELKPRYVNKRTICICVTYEDKKVDITCNRLSELM